MIVVLMGMQAFAKASSALVRDPDDSLTILMMSDMLRRARSNFDDGEYSIHVPNQPM